MASLEKLKKIKSTDYSSWAEKLWQLCVDSYPHGSPWSAAQFQEDVMRESSHYLLYTDEEQLIGFVSYQQVLDEADITHVVIEKNSQNQGYGKDMLLNTFRIWQENRLQKVFLEVRASNLSAQKVYNKLGFQCIHRRKNYYHHPQEDGLVMELRIEEGD
ncbi:ribosomal protein S18-alanine N-acetyltransferase [Enterococcus sp. LJL128]|uniref:ribosomal protein S18-alanine N-acetyltransferase n=1 Tax=Enterococcus sp. LJL51 TaxID=3416656 RepID=UPI003CF353AF